MSNFKVGDKVVRLDGTPIVMFQKILGSEEYYIVTYVSNCGRWIQVDGVQHLGDAAPWSAINFKLYQEPGDDELPPVPDSVVYFNSVRDKGNDQRLELSINCAAADFYTEAAGNLGLAIIPRTGSSRAAKSIGVNLSPDAALQLAHDLRRMAMHNKRKDKALCGQP